MFEPSRRGFLSGMGGALVLSVEASFRALGLQSPSSRPPGEFAGLAPFLGEGRRALGRVTGRGLDGRRSVDLSDWSVLRTETPNDRFYIRTRSPRGLDSKAWQLELRGRGVTRSEFSPGELAALGEARGAHLLECSGNGPSSGFGLVSCARWEGVPVAPLLEKAGLRDPDALVRIGGLDPAGRSAAPRRGASWIFRLEHLRAQGAFLATRMNGAALPADHGHPLRLVVPGWYGCTCIKWIDEVVGVSADAPATEQMREYAERTHQRGTPRLARDYRAASIDLTALPVRVEKWRARDRLAYRVVGLVWGGDGSTDALRIRFGTRAPYVPIDDVAPGPSSAWRLWTHRWSPAKPGRYLITLRVDDPEVRTRRLDRGYYAREVRIDEV